MAPNAGSAGAAGAGGAGAGAGLSQGGSARPAPPSQALQRARPVRLGSSRAAPGRYKVTVSEPIPPSEAAAIRDYLVSLPHVTGVSVSGRLVTVQLDKDRYWKDIKQRVELGVHNVVEPGVPHSPEELKKHVQELRAAMLGGPGAGAGAQGDPRAPGDPRGPRDQKFPGLSLLAEKSLSALDEGEGRAGPRVGREMLAFLQEACLEVLTVAINPVLERDGGSCSLASIAPAREGAGYVVRLDMKGACKGCPASTITMKAFIEKTICEYIPEISAVEESGGEEEGDGAADAAASAGEGEGAGEDAEEARASA